MASRLLSMRSKFLSLRKSVISVINVRNYASKDPLLGGASVELQLGFIEGGFITSDRCDAHMNELPIPCGPWEPWYKDKQTYYTQWLVFGAIWWLFSLGVVIYTKSIFFNWGPPDMPGPPSDYVEECEEVE